ncbi:serine/threonine protein kinase [Nibricoccus aquaticus]|uniref:Serine/threonine protein kinase n=1 Tax=Nibricoccus aquaticus TaxID=2576891 RepID=A0A290Q4B2_9BACT|nr:serine/threonine-protein kinase [Nibricoccus aquaticus]ATC63515.1 serine/threonine protein kinase [Nibricoccus aquaticus]
MKNAAAQREEDLFEAARERRTAAERKAFLDRACVNEPELRARLDGLLAAGEEGEAFFEEGGALIRSKLPGEEAIGAKIGRYKLVQKIGEGGCGVVYLAEQEEPVRRSVALKIIKLGMETKSVIARFEAERQALAMMDHPNIARVFDAGATDRGPPYFVMELVRGVKITDYCDRNRLGVSERLDLFIQICHAIQHAHQKGIIHGDIKPSNVLVEEHDGEAVPKVIDFGISKATEARLTDKLFTTYAQLIGTPAYMSPEQAQMGGVDIDTRTDIYSLGVLLYELLTGRTPFDPQELAASGLDEMRKTLREREPARPSARLNALALPELIRVANTRLTDPARLLSSVRGDLDWISMRALEKDRARRYETANGLALDVQRHLHNEPVVASPPSWAYRLQKLVRRNRVVFIAGGAVALALVFGMSASTWLFLKERAAHQRALKAEQQQARLRLEAETRERITQAALLVSQERFAEADAMLKEISLKQPSLEGAAVIRAVGEWHALENRWSEAAGRFSQLLEVDALEGVDVITLDYLRCGPALLEAGDQDGYRRFRDEAVARFARVASPFSDRIVKISLLGPVDGAALAALRPMAEDTTRAYEESVKAGDVFQAAWRAMALALLEYRKGNDAAAVEWARRSMAAPDQNASRALAAGAILAMARERLGQREEARGDLLTARELLENRLKSGMDRGRGTPVQGFWFDYAFARILLREAEGVVGAK